MTREFNNKSTSEEVLESIHLTGKRALVTGGASGIGAETVRALASKGAEVLIAARNIEKAEQVKASVVSATGNQNIHLLTLELGSLRRINDTAQDFHKRFDSLDLLVNNAGIMACPFGKTEDGFELQFGSNHIGHFYLTSLLMPALLKTAQPRVVSLTSMAHRMSPVVFDDINYESRAYEKWAAYGQSKTANALFAVGLSSRFSDNGLEAFSVHPGVIATPLGRHLERGEIERITKENQKSSESTNQEADQDQGGIKSVEQGAATSCFAATAPELTGKGGAYLEDCHIAEVVADDPSLRGGVRDYAIDAQNAERLWAASDEMIEARLRGH